MIFASQQHFPSVYSRSLSTRIYLQPNEAYESRKKPFRTISNSYNAKDCRIRRILSWQLVSLSFGNIAIETQMGQIICIRIVQYNNDYVNYMFVQDKRLCSELAQLLVPNRNIPRYCFHSKLFPSSK